jgi:RNA polymerase sigma factor (sigma-70 family)
MEEEIDASKTEDNSENDYRSYEAYMRIVENAAPHSEVEIRTLAYSIQKNAKEIRKLVLGTPYAGRVIVQWMDDKSLCAPSVIGKIKHKRDLIYKLTEELYSCYNPDNMEEVKSEAKIIRARLYKEIIGLRIGTESIENIISRIKEKMTSITHENAYREVRESHEALQERIAKTESYIKTYEKSLNELVSRNLKLAIKYFKRFWAEESVFMDAIAIGNKGLVKAAKSFKPSKGCTFSTFVYECMKNEYLGAPRIKSSEETTLDAQVYAHDPQDPTTYKDLLEDTRISHPSETIQTKKVNPEIKKELQRRLNPKEFKMIVRVLNLDGNGEKTTAEIAREMGVTRAYTNKLYNDALRKLKTPELRALFIECL